LLEEEILFNLKQRGVKAYVGVLKIVYISMDRKNIPRYIIKK